MLQSSQSLFKSYRYKNFGNHGQRHVVLAPTKRNVADIRLHTRIDK